MKELKTVASFANPMLANISRGLLESNGIRAEVFGEVSALSEAAKMLNADS